MDYNWQMLAAMITVFGVAINIVGFFILKFNDLSHLHVAVKEVKEHLDKQDKKMHTFEISLTDLTARFQERTKTIKRKTR